MRKSKVLIMAVLMVLGTTQLLLAGGIPKVGSKAPGFKLSSDQGAVVSLAQSEGKTVVLYFYPKDMTPGCTKEACSFRDHYQELLKKGVVLLGISVDPLASHKEFQEKYSLPFPLLSDNAKKVVKKYGVWQWNKERKAYGTIRSTFLIGPDGKILKIWSPVTVEGHTEEILKSL